MHTVAKTALVASATALAALSLLAGPVMAQVAPAAPVAPPAPAVAETPPSVAFSHHLVAAAAAFETYTGRAATLRADFADPEAVATALRAGSAYEPRQMQAGEIAFAAVVALEDPAFVQGARELARDPRAVELLINDPSAVAGVPGAQAAADKVSAALRDRGAKVLAVGTAVKQSAYDIQHQPWALT